jgi:signal peptidase II
MSARLIAALVLIGIDQLSKWVFRDQSVLNRGGIFGFAQGMWWELVLLPVLMYLVYVWIREKNRFQVVGLTLLVAGGAGNLVDRLVRGGVIDFIYYPLFGFRGNIADIYLALAVVVVVYAHLRSAHESNKHE